MNTPSLRCFNPHLPFRTSFRHLPHWEQSGVCAFVTMRMKDSIPESVHQQYLEWRARCCRQFGMPDDVSGSLLMEQMSPSERRRFQRVASTLYQHALDKGAGECVLREPQIRKELEEVLHMGNQHFFTLGAGVIMPNHVHLLLQPFEGTSLSSILSSIRRVSSRRINPLLGRSGELWQTEPFDHLIRSPGKYKKFAAYIRLNPVRAGLSVDEVSLWEGDL